MGLIIRLKCDGTARWKMVSISQAAVMNTHATSGLKAARRGHVRARGDRIQLRDRQHSGRLNSKNSFENVFVHPHVPAGGHARGESLCGHHQRERAVVAGMQMPVARQLAMTGELTLAGHLVPLGGIARRSSLHGARVIRNRSCRRTIEPTSTHDSLAFARASPPSTRYTSYTRIVGRRPHRYCCCLTMMDDHD